jgi:hypothetical protein
MTKITVAFRNIANAPRKPLMQLPLGFGFNNIAMSQAHVQQAVLFRRCTYSFQITRSQSERA